MHLCRSHLPAPANASRLAHASRRTSSIIGSRTLGLLTKVYGQVLASYLHCTLHLTEKIASLKHCPCSGGVQPCRL